MQEGPEAETMAIKIEILHFRSPDGDKDVWPAFGDRPET
jgi:hypothetical protein